MLSLGATLISDDRVIIRLCEEGGLIASAPDTINGWIEARGFGVLKTACAPAILRAVVDLDQIETERMPGFFTTKIGGVTLPLIKKVESPAFASILMLYLKGERVQI